jgi:TonB family protein
MIAPIEFSAQPPMHALGWTLLHFCWQGAGVAAVLWCVLKVMDGRSSRVRYAAACLALGMMIALPLATFAHLASAEFRQRAVFGGSAVAIDAGMVLQVGAGEMSAPWTERIAATLDHALPWVLLAWFAGVIFFVARLNVGLMVARRMRLVATKVPPAELLQTFDALRRRLGVARAVRLMHSALVQVPTVIGWLRPVVLVPASCLSGLSTMQIEAILAHELAHIRRHDYLVSVLQSVIETLLFYHPAVWWVSRQVRRERECCCDEMAVAVGGDRLAYAKALSVLEERRSCTPEFVLGANGGVLTMRIRRLLGRGGASISSQLAAGMVLAILLAAAGSYGLTAARAEVNALSRAVRAASPMELEAASPLNTLIAEPAVRQLKTMLLQPAAASGNSVEFDRSGIPYTTWLNQDVLWIITPEERAAFLNLANDEERDKFIEQFWARRDPPSSPANTFKYEYYGRIAYSNEHFVSESPGWRSDRGRMYILYGKPDSVDSHPSGGTYPYEVWHYHSADGHGIDMMFEDTCQCGKYLLESQNTAAVGVAEGQAPRLIEPASPLNPRLFAAGGQAPRLIEPASPLNPRLFAEVRQFQLKEPVMMAQAEAPAAPATTDAPTVPGGPVSILAGVAAAPDGPVRIPSGVVEGMILSKTNPVYPEVAKAAHVQGAVILHAIISKDGTVERLNVISGNGMLVNAARDAVSQWKFKPYLLNGQPTEVETSITVNFSLPVSGTAQGPGRDDDAALTQAEQEYRDLLALQPNGPNIRSIDCKGLNSVTIQEVVERFNRDAVGLKVETPFDVARVSRAADELKQLLSERGHPNAKVIIQTKTIPPGAIGILFIVIEGPKGVAQVQSPVANDADTGHVQGAVILHALISKTGTVDDLDVIGGAGMLRSSAQDAVMQKAQARAEQDYKDGRIVPIQIGGDVTPPVPIWHPSPEYTAEAKKAKFMGVVTVGIIVDKNGIPQNVHVTKGVGMGLDEKAVEAVKRYRFKSATENGKPVAVYENVEVNFEIF